MLPASNDRFSRAVSSGPSRFATSASAALRRAARAARARGLVLGVVLEDVRDACGVRRVDAYDARRRPHARVEQLMIKIFV